jgi:hypothetical protein
MGRCQAPSIRAAEYAHFQWLLPPTRASLACLSPRRRSSGPRISRTWRRGVRSHSLAPPRRRRSAGPPRQPSHPPQRPRRPGCRRAGPDAGRGRAGRGCGAVAGAGGAAGRVGGGGPGPRERLGGARARARAAARQRREADGGRGARERGGPGETPCMLVITNALPPRGIPRRVQQRPLHP